MNEKKLALLVGSGAPVRLEQAATMVASAVLLDWEVIVVWMGDALPLLVEGRLDEGARPESRPSALLAEARALGRVSYLACSADSRRLGRSRRELLGHVNDILAMTTILRRIQDAGTKMNL